MVSLDRDQPAFRLRKLEEGGCQGSAVCSERAFPTGMSDYHALSLLILGENAGLVLPRSQFYILDLSQGREKTMFFQALLASVELSAHHDYT